jgi:hypothetical protein|tara:strand:- start:521 stop:703 length:183 start_codon:yes stop_codon:yes gene_type:complete
MEWLLVFLLYDDGKIAAHEIGKFKSLTECFQSREQLGSDIGSADGYFPINYQAICVHIKE